MLEKKENQKRDEVVIIYGKPRAGKSSLGLRLVNIWIKFQYPEYREIYKFSDAVKNCKLWEKIFKKNFVGSAEEAIDKLGEFETGDLLFIDEGVDVARSDKMFTQEQSNLLSLLQKVGNKRLFIIIITPSYKMFTKRFLARAHHMFLIPTMPQGNGNVTLLYKNHEFPPYAEARPFDLVDIFHEAEKVRPYSEEFLWLKLTRSDCYIGDIKYTWIDEKIYKRYEKIVKEPNLLRITYQYTPTYRNYIKYKYILGNLLWRLRKNAPRTAIVRDLGYDKYGNKLLTENMIKKMEEWIDNIEELPKELENKKI